MYLVRRRMLPTGYIFFFRDPVGDLRYLYKRFFKSSTEDKAVWQNCCKVLRIRAGFG